MIPPVTSPEDRDALAGEYALGTLEAREAAEVERALATDADLARRVASWESRLAPLLALVPAAAPPPDLWARIEASLPAAAAAAAAAPAEAPQPRRPAEVVAFPGGRGRDDAARRDPAWRRLALPWAIGATALAAGLAAFLVVRPPAPEGGGERLMTVLLTQRDQPAWIVESEGRDLRLSSLNTQVPPDIGDRVLQLWALPQGATAPTSLGIVPPSGEVRVSPGTIRPEPGMLIEITLEPPGGSPTGRPTGPIQFIGRLGAARGS